MKCNWHIKKLSEIAHINPKESICKGITAKKVPMDKLQPFCRDIPEFVLEEYKGGAKFRNSDTIMARITPCLENGKISKVSIFDNDEVGFGSTEYIVFRAIEGVSDADFLYYLICSPLVRNPAIKSMVGSSGRQRVQTDVVADLDIELPNIEVQRKIGSILRTLDDKITLNNTINNNLEQQIKTLYTYYFIDGRKDDWKEIPLSEIIFFQEGPGIRNWQYAEDGVKFINIRCINNGEIDTSTSNKISNEEANGKYSHFMLEPYDIVMSCSGTLGRYAIVQQKDLPLCLNTSVIRFRPKNYASDYSYVYGYITSNEFLNQQQMMANGSAQVNFGPTHLKKIVIYEPPMQLRKEFNDLVFSMIESLIVNREERNSLIKIRDTLLPKLISGELDVSDIDI